MTVWPALFPPCERMTICALAARKSMTLPLPSSPHWPPTRMMTMGLLRPGFGSAGLQVVEAGVVPAELELDHPGGAVPVLGDDDLGDSGAVLGLVILGPIKKHYNITILFNRPAFAKVAEDRPLVRTLLRRPAQLRDGDHRYPKLACQTLQSARDRRDLLHPIVIAAGAPMHELQVVDDDEVDVVPHLGLASLELQRQLVHRRRVIDVNRRLPEGPEGIGHSVELCLAQQSAMQPLSVDLGLLRQQALRELFLGHLEAEDRNCLGCIQRCMQRNVQCQGGFAHRGPARHDDQVRVLAASSHPVQVVDTRWAPDYSLLALD